MMMDKIDYKKTEKALYQPKKTPSVVTVPPMTMLMVDGQGDPNDPAGSYSEAVGLLYALSYTIKMSKMGADKPAGYFEYVVPPLEGLWWMAGREGVDYAHKELFIWTAMIRQQMCIRDRAAAASGPSRAQRIMVKRLFILLISSTPVSYTHLCLSSPMASRIPRITSIHFLTP